MIVVDKKQNCCGCGACANACPAACIHMTADEEGFLYPLVNTAACINCGQCNRVCPILKGKPKNLPNPAAYAAINRTDETRKTSSSGGLFSLLAEYVLKQNGVVFGAVFNKDFSISHAAIEKEEDIPLLRGSKYVQSDLGKCFQQAKQFLEDGRIVLFTGTACQVAALLTFLHKPYPNLITQDLICHGTPSPAVWKAYLKYRSDLAGSEITEVSFRKKLDGKKGTHFYMRFENGEEYIRSPHGSDDYMKWFLYNKCLRPSCHHCRFKGLRSSDITLADFWGIDAIAPAMNDGNGISLVLANTPKGEEILEAVREKIVCKKVRFRRALWKNPSYFYSAGVSPVRKKFMRDFQLKPFAQVVKRHNKLL